MVQEIDIVLRTVLGLSILVVVGRVLGGLLSKIKVPEIVGEISSGIILAPSALGGLIYVFGGPLIELNELMLAFASFGGIIILFAAGLEFTFADFRRAGIPSFVVATSGVIVPFALSYTIATRLGFSINVSMLIGAVLTATSIAVTVNVLEELRIQHTDEAKIIINAAVIDDVLGLAVLAVVISIVHAGKMLAFSEITLITLKALLMWLIMLVAASYVLPRLINIAELWKSEGTVEVVAIAFCFGLAALSVAIGLSYFVGAFAAGMAVAGSRAILRIKEFVSKLKLIFGPLFFSIIGTYLDITKIGNIGIVLTANILLIAIASKVVGCGMPAMLFLRDKDKGIKVGVGMVPRGEVGLIIAGLGFTAGMFTESNYASLVFAVMATTIIAPILLRRLYVKR